MRRSRWSSQGPIESYAAASGHEKAPAVNRVRSLSFNTQDKENDRHAASWCGLCCEKLIQSSPRRVQLAISSCIKKDRLRPFPLTIHHLYHRQRSQPVTQIFKDRQPHSSSAGLDAPSRALKTGKAVISIINSRTALKGRRLPSGTPWIHPQVCCLTYLHDCKLHLDLT